jgi:4-amino-4-deoxy-L-arabinose transferase-like glycosyltransferase
LGSAAAFGLLLLLIGLVTSRWYGRLAGVIASFSLLLMPRVFGHAHLAALETVMNLAYAAAILSVAAWWKYPEDTATRPPKFGRTAFAGVLWGLALLTKIQAVLIGPPVVIWALWHWRRKALVPLLVWGIAGLAVFFAGWPWLWFDPWEHALEYFRSTTNRSTLYVWYFGERFADVAVPWHYPFVMFLTTMPLGLLLLGMGGFAGRDAHHPSFRRDGKLQLVLAAGLFPLVLFAVPGVAVYDGARLFLVSSPMWAIAIGRGAALVWEWLQARINIKLAGIICCGLLLAQGYGLWATSPCYLSYYNLAIGGLPGAERQGMETTYWGDSLTRDIWDHIAQTVPEGGIVHVTPVLHPLQLSFLQSQLPRLRDKGITLAPCIPEQTALVEYLVLFERKADLPPAILEAIANREPQFEISRQGVRLSAFYHLGQDPQ